MGLPSFVEPYGQGVYAIDTGFHRDRFDAAYLVVQAGRAAFIDTGTNHALPRLIGALEALGIAKAQVDWVIPTHVHLDHAGGAGALMQALPGATMVVHPRGAPHMIDPTRLYEGALAVYGQAEMDRSYGQLVPVDAARVRTSSDGMDLMLADRPLHFIDTPGHARHHHCIWDALTQGWFTGDTFGLSYREFDTDAGPWILPTSTPVQFDPEALQASIDRLLLANPQCMYLTHYGRVQGIPRLGRMLCSMLGAMVDIGRRMNPGPDRGRALRAALLELYAGSLQRHGVTATHAQVAEWLTMDIELNAQGIEVWLDRPARS